MLFVIHYKQSNIQNLLYIGSRAEACGITTVLLSGYIFYVKYKYVSLFIQGHEIKGALGGEITRYPVAVFKKPRRRHCFGPRAFLVPT